MLALNKLFCVLSSNSSKITFIISKLMGCFKVEKTDISIIFKENIFHSSNDLIEILRDCLHIWYIISTLNFQSQVNFERRIV